MKREKTDYETYRKHLGKIADIGFASSVLGWDQQTYMPKKGAEYRGQQVATLSSLAHEMFIDPKFGELLKALQQDAKLGESERENVALTVRDYTRKLKYSAEFVERMSKLASESFAAWHEARAKSDFKIYEPFLAKMIELKKQEAELVGYAEHPYEALLEDYEPGMTVKKIDQCFDQVKKQLFPFIQKILKQPKPEAHFIQAFYAKEKQWLFAARMIEQMGYSFETGRADDAPHPFCTTFGPGRRSDHDSS